MMSGPNHLTSIHWIIRFVGNAGVLSQVATEAKAVPKFKNTFQIIWSALREKAIEDYCERLQACVSANGGHFEHLM